ncbi:MAG: peptidoglycan editing factor PgeF [Halanaerobiales bacterium]|nr:peptidoglycan editing factor PgeF [Halanaerobiales bacterium]
MVKKVSKNGVEWMVFERLSKESGIVHGFSTRIGGVSQAPYDGLNLAFHVGDDLEDIIINRRRFLNVLGLWLEDLTAGEQVHSDKIRIVKREERGRGTFNYETAFSGTDGFITNEPGVVLSSYYADCVPLFIYDPVNKVVGLAHAGWKGTLMRIGARTIEKMTENFGTKGKDCLVGIGPSIGSCCYEVDERVIEPLRAEFSEWKELVVDKGSGRWNLNLWETNRQVFLNAGVSSENIEMSELCTSCNTDIFFSYRREGGITGRMASIITLK